MEQNSVILNLSKNAFKRKIEEKLINILNAEDSYIYPKDEIRFYLDLYRLTINSSSVLRLDQPNYYAYFLFEGKHLFNVHET